MTLPDDRHDDMTPDLNGPPPARDDAAVALLGRCPIFRRCGPDDLQALAAQAR